jgi:hypothetical protein
MEMTNILKKLTKLDAGNPYAGAKLTVDSPLVTVSNVYENIQPVEECGDSTGPVTPHTPASINITANSGDEVANMIKSLVSLAGVSSTSSPVAKEIELSSPHVADTDSDDMMKLIGAVDRIGGESDDDYDVVIDQADESMYLNSPDEIVEPHDYGDKQVTPKPQGLKQRVGDNPYKVASESIDAMADKLMSEYRQFVNESTTNEISDELANSYRRRATADAHKAYREVERHGVKKYGGRDDSAKYAALHRAMNDPDADGMRLRTKKRSAGIQMVDKKLPKTWPGDEEGGTARVPASTHPRIKHSFDESATSRKRKPR